MAFSDDFLRQAERRQVKGGLDADGLRELFFRYLDAVPEDLRWDIFNRYAGGQDSSAEMPAMLRQFALVIDLFEGEYDEVVGGLADEDLAYIGEGVNDYALEISDEVLMNVMKVVVSRGLLG